MIHWYALQTKPQKAPLVSQQLTARNIPVFAPQLTIKPVNPRARSVRPLFPGYVFVRTDLDSVGQSFFQYLPCAVGLVSFGGVPAVVEPELLREIEQRLAQINAAGGESFMKFRPGDRVRIEHGPFAGLEAIFDGRLRDSERVRVLIELIGQRQIVLELNVGYVVS
ncbi:transcription termination/antitermination protein NusG [Candidatus Viridilinea mediisalina]|uniref:transcription termination/antitermination protein NusG n=1 Tax=Candidatus Viridilinea mediisalina TaxID=2024553 RepID=UPI0013FD9DAC|nr:transcription termination/antitermination NusG family protein [Candidatus Viridilinea mediisalina]